MNENVAPGPVVPGPVVLGPVVLGGGMAGVAAAMELARRGLRPTLLESRPYLGGRARSFEHTTGDEIDNGQHLLMGCYRSTFRLLEMLGTRDLVQTQRSLRVEFRDADGRRDVLAAPRLPAPLGVLVGMARMSALTIAERMALLRLGVALRLGGPRGDETAADYLARHGQPARLRQRLWDPMIIATLNLPAERASALLFARVMRLAFLGRGEDSHLAFARCGLSKLLAPARAAIERRGGTVVTGAPALGIVAEHGGYTIFLKDRPPLRASALITAVPERALRQLLGSTELADRALGAMPHLEYSPIVSAYLWYDHPLERLPAFAAMIGTATQWMFNRRAIDGSSNARFPGLVTCTISAAAAESAIEGEAIAAIVDRELRAAFPEIGDARLVERLVVKEKHATFAATPAAERVRPQARTQAQHLYLAGDWTATGLPATIEGAVQSGFAAAAALADDALGRNP